MLSNSLADDAEGGQASPLKYDRSQKSGQLGLLT